MSETPKKRKPQGNMKRDPKTGLTEKQEAFVSELLLNGGNLTQAAIKAGYAEGSAYQRGYELAQNERVQEQLMIRRRRMYQGAGTLGLKWLMTALDDPDVADSVKEKIAFGLVDRAGDKHAEKLEVDDKRTPEEMQSRLAQLLGVEIEDEDEQRVH